MRLQADIIEKIDRYLCGELAPEDAIAFARDIDADPELAAQVEAQRQHLEAMELILADDLREKMAAWRSETIENQNVTPPRSAAARYWPWVFAGAVALALAVFWARKKTGENAPETQAPAQTTDSVFRQTPNDKPAESPESQPNTPENQQKVKPSQPALAPKYIAAVERSRGEVPAFLAQSSEEALRGDDSKTDFAKGLEAAAKGDYAKALTLLEAVSPDVPDFIEANFFRALVLLKTGRSAEAAATLEPMAANSGYLRQEQAEWFLAMALLDQKRVAEAESRLQSMADDASHGFQARAAALLKNRQ